jgi:hypothetical protein
MAPVGTFAQMCPSRRAQVLHWRESVKHVRTMPPESRTEMIVATLVGCALSGIAIFMVLDLELYSERLFDHPGLAVVMSFTNAAGIAALGLASGIRKDRQRIMDSPARSRSEEPS